MKDSLNIDRIAFIGRTYEEYAKIFDLNESLLRRGKVLDCPAGASSFTAEAHRAGLHATACDILFNQDIHILAEKGKSDIRHVQEKINEVPHLYRWNYYKDVNGLIAKREKALRLFMEDFRNGTGEGRYVQAELPRLPFQDGSFHLVLSSHFLFLYGGRLNAGFHGACLKELVRICSGEVRIYPLTGLDAKMYPDMDDILSFLQSGGIMSEIVKTPFEFQKGANQMLILRRA